MTPGETLRALRIRAGLTQQELADRAGIDRSWLNQIERGKRALGPSPRGKLAAVLKVSPVELGADAAVVPKYRPLLDRQGELEAEVLELARLVQGLSRRVIELERRARPEAGEGAA